MVDDWRLIETAPKDGTKVLGALCDGECAVVYWLVDGWRESRVWSGGEVSVTHWMPLPAPPEM